MSEATATAEASRSMRGLLALFGVAVLVTGVALTRGADPASASVSAPVPAIAAPAGIKVGLNEMGLGSQVTFTGLTTEQDLAIPVPDGMKPAALVGDLVLPTDIDRGWIEVISGTVRVDVVNFSAKQAGSQGIAVSIPLTNVPVVNRSASLRLVSHLIPADPTCYDRSFSYPLTLTTPSVIFSGNDSYSSTVADFLPPILRTLTIDVRGALTASSSQAVLTLSSRIVQRYSGEPTKIELNNIGSGVVPTTSSDPLVRTIVVDPTGIGAVAILATNARPALLVTGSSGSLADQIAGLTSDLSQIAQSSSATFAGATTPVSLAPKVVNFTDLGIGNLNSTGAGTVSVSFGIDEATLGGRPSALGIDLRASYTPLPSSVGGLLSFEANGRQLASWATQRSGQLREHVEVPGADLTRYTTFTLALSLAGNTGECGNELTDTLTIDPNSTITVTLANSGIVGFQSLPQSLVPMFDVGIAGSSFADLVRTDTIVNGLQSETSVPLSPQLVSTSTALQARIPALVVYPSTDAPKTLDLPLRHVDTTKYVESAPPGTTANGSASAAVQLGCIQVVTDVAHKRLLVVASSPDGTGALLDKILTWLNATPDRWSSLDGNVLATAAAGSPFTLTVGVANVSDSSTSISVAVVIVACVVIIVVLGLFVIWVALRRRRVGVQSAGTSGSGDEEGR
jgi:hypothetical protein